MPVAEAKAEQKKIVRKKYQVLAGNHSEFRVDDQGNQVVLSGSMSDARPDGIKEMLHYKRGDIFESHIDWAARFPEKFRRIDGNSPIETVTKTVVKPLESLTVKELRSFAEDNEIDLDTANTKDEIINVIRHALPG